MGKIEQHISDAGVLAAAQEHLARAKELIAAGPIAFGENHNSVVARAIIWDLMAGGRVKRFFTEQPNEKMFEQTLEGNLQALANPVFGEDGAFVGFPGGASEAELSEPIEKLYGLLERLNQIQGRRENPIPYVNLMRRAVQCSVTVYCYDIRVKNGTPHDDAMKFRNEHMTQRYLTAANHTEPGTVLLGGSHHFDEHSEPNLLTTMGIPVESYFGLGEHKV